MTFDPTNFDPDQHADGVSELLAPGEYVFVVKSFKRLVRKGKDQIDFMFKAILDARKQRVPASKSPVWETVTIAPNAIWRLANLCKAVGHQGPFNINDDAQLAAVVKNKPFKAQIAHETYQGSKSARLKRYVMISAEEKKSGQEILEDMAVDDASGGGGYGDYQDNDNYDPGYAPEYADEDIPF